MIYPNEEDPNKFKTFVNGDLLTEPIVINHADRVLFGNHNYFLYVDPEINLEEEVDWEVAMKEVLKD
jgi:hypothetical protein